MFVYVMKCCGEYEGVFSSLESANDHIRNYDPEAGQLEKHEFFMDFWVSDGDWGSYTLSYQKAL
jgi:hypothetical protein